MHRVVLAYTVCMRTNPLRVAASLLDAKYKTGVPGVSRPRIEGRSRGVTYSITSAWDLRVKEERIGILRQKTKRQWRSVRGHVFHLQSRWHDQSFSIQGAQDHIAAVPALPGEKIELSSSQLETLGRLLTVGPAWRSLTMDSSGY